MKLSGSIPEGNGNPGRLIKRFAVKQDGSITFLGTDQVDWIEAARDYVRLHTMGRSFLVRGTLRTVEQHLDPTEFARIHRSSLVRIDRIASLSPLFHGDYVVHLCDGTQLRLSRKYRKALVDVLGFGF